MGVINNDKIESQPYCLKASLKQATNRTCALPAPCTINQNLLAQRNKKFILKPYIHTR